MIWKILLFLGICLVAGIVGGFLSALMDAWIKRIEETNKKDES